MSKKDLMEMISGMIDNLSTMKEHLEKEECQHAYEYADGIVNDSNELRNSLECLLETNE